MDLLLAHIPHLALLLGVGLLFIQMMMGEKRMQLVLASGGEQAAEQVRVLTMRSAVRMLLMLLFLAAVVVMAVEVLRDELPSALLAVDYLLAGGVLAIWMAWQAPSAQASSVQARMGAGGRAVVRMAVGIVTVGVLVIAGMAMAHGVVLPPL